MEMIYPHSYTMSSFQLKVNSVTEEISYRDLTLLDNISKLAYLFCLLPDGYIQLTI